MMRKMRQAQFALEVDCKCALCAYAKLPRIRGALPRILREFCRELGEQLQAHTENTENYDSVSRYVEVDT